ncbi:MAG: hypothetical protein GPJ54_06770 [Candidatus Heimdallarchaeota archaeon]|nr:hypothetical protein [Candidatus Heimdallarchaeota archaeon]
MSEFFIVRLTPNQSKMQSNMEEKALLGKGHGEYIEKLVENKFIKFGGPIDGKPGGMLIVSAESKENVENIFNEDPMIKNNYLFVEVNKWTISHGML